MEINKRICKSASMLRINFLYQVWCTWLVV